jgi:hypothetical protein
MIYGFTYTAAGTCIDEKIYGRVKTAILAVALLGAVGCEQEQPEIWGVKAGEKKAEVTNTLVGTPKQENNNSTKPLEIKEETKSSLPKVSGGTIRRTNTESDEEGIKDVEVFLDQEKINLLSERRDNRLINEKPDFFGIDGEFQPLLKFKVKGAGQVIIRGKLIGEIIIETSEQAEEIEVYPDFKLGELFKSDAINEEEISIIFKQGEKETLSERFSVKCSETDEIFIEDKNLNDLVSLTEEDRLRLKVEGINNVESLILGAIRGLDKFGIEYEPLPERKGFLKIKDGREFRESKKANSLDLCVWLSKKARENGYPVSIVITPQDAILGIKSIEENGNEKTLYIDTKLLLRRSIKDFPTNYSQGENELFQWRLDKAILSGEAIVKKNFKENPEKMFALELAEWEKVYRDFKE